MDKKAKIKKIVSKLKEKKKKKEGDPNIKGVDKPSKKQQYIQKLKREKSQKKKQKAPVMVGPKGGKYEQSSSGKKHYGEPKQTGVDRGASVQQRLANEKQKRAKKAVEDFVTAETLMKTLKEGEAND